MPTPRQSAKAKKLKGNPGKAALVNEPKPMAATLEAPASLSPAALAYWKELAPMLVGLGLLSEADTSEFGRWCEVKAEVDLHRQTLQADGWTINVPVMDTHGHLVGHKPRNHPAAAFLRAAERQLAALSIQFGLTPRGRSGLNVPAGEEKGSAFDRLMDSLRNANSAN